MAVVLEPAVKARLAGLRFVVPEGRVCESGQSASQAARDLGERVVVKALVPTGRKGVGGGVRIASSAMEAGEHSEAILGMTLNGFPVTQVYVERQLEIEDEFYFAVMPSGVHQTYEVVFSVHGGVNIEELGADHIVSMCVDPDREFPDYQARKLAHRAGVESAQIRVVSSAIADLVNFAIRNDAQLFEVNPLVTLTDGNVGVAGAMLSVDESALFRHPDMAAIALRGVDSLGRPLTDLELHARRLNEEIPEGDMRLIEFDQGDIGFLTLGGGCGLVALDALAASGEMPATAFDMTSGNIEEKFFRITAAVLSLPRLRALFVGGNISAMTPVPIRTRGLIRALRHCDRDWSNFPVVVRLPGPQDEEAARLLEEFPHVDFFTDDVTIEGAVERLVQRLKGVSA